MHQVLVRHDDNECCQHDPSILWHGFHAACRIKFMPCGMAPCRLLSQVVLWWDVKAKLHGCFVRSPKLEMLHRHHLSKEPAEGSLG
jgi:hypothetical protein